MFVPVQCCLNVHADHAIVPAVSQPHHACSSVAYMTVDHAVVLAVLQSHHIPPMPAALSCSFQCY